MKRNGSKELEQSTHLSLKMQGAASENVALTDKRKCSMSDKSYIPVRGIYLQRLPLILTLQKK